MKTFRIVAAMVLCIGLLISSTSCVVLVPDGHEKHGKHQNWDKHNDPYHPYSPGHDQPKGKHKK